MGLKGKSAIIGVGEFKPEKIVPGVPGSFTLEQVSELSRLALADAGLGIDDVNGLVVSGITESAYFIPSTVIEYLGIKADYGDVVDLGGASAVGMVWRAAAAIEMGMADVVLCVIASGLSPTGPAESKLLSEQRPFGSSSNLWGSPQAEFDIPYGHIAQNAGYAQIAQRYAHEYGYDQRATAKIAVDHRTNACANPQAIFHGQPITIEDVLNSKMVAPPLHKLEIVMPVFGGAAVVLASREKAAKSNNRPAWVTGCGERVEVKSRHYAKDMLKTPIKAASQKAFKMAGIKHCDIDLMQPYDCYTITVLMTIEDAGFCGKGEGMAFVLENDMTYKGNFPVNSHGGQLSFGQTGLAGGMSHVTEAARQIMGKGHANQLEKCNNVFVSGTGGIMCEQSAIILQGD
jgi:acetyl-CoA C-acetyltransferase